jgi:transcriptional regulator with XRE-family HTH domain
VVKKVANPFLVQFGANLKKIRESKNLTQAQLAIDCDSDISYISRIENGKISPSLIYLKKMADVMEMELKQLFEF